MASGLVRAAQQSTKQKAPGVSKQIGEEKMNYQYIETKYGNIGVEIISKHLFGLVLKCKVHYAETPLLSRKAFRVWRWQVKQ